MKRRLLSGRGLTFSGGEWSFQDGVGSLKGESDFSEKDMPFRPNMKERRRVKGWFNML